MTPLSFPSTTATQPSSFSNSPSPSSPEDSITPHFLPMSHTRSHGKRRDPSYIPRPSNAFILFRSAFIRDRKVSDKVEGNHSSLSKIIGHSWKKLSPDERERWEAEAVAAQAQHRAMYPDWRFRPGSNALAKLKTKDGGPTMRRRSARVKAPLDEAGDDDSDHKGKGQEKGKGKNRSALRTPSLEEMRCAKIADFVADGIQGEELEVAVKEWEGDRKMGKQRSQKPRASRARGASSSSTHARYTTLTMASSPASDNQYLNNPSPDSTSNLPQSSQHLIIDAHERRDSISFPMPSGTNMATNFDAPQQHLAWQDAENQRRMEEIQEPNLWWGDSRSAEVGPWYSKVDGPTEHNGGRCTSATTEMGYENSGVNPFDSGYGEYTSYDPPHDGSQNVEWTDLSNNTDRHGLVTVLENPYRDSSNPNSPDTLSPPTIYTPPPLSSSYYYTQLPPSSFSTLTGWAGDYKDQTSNPKAWPDNLSAPAPPSSSSTSSNWYSSDGTYNWGGGFQHGHCHTLDSEDWDRLEYRTASELHLAVEPLRLNNL